MFALAALHGIGTGSDTQTWWALGIYLVSIVLVGALLCRRVLSSKGRRKHAPAQPVTAARVVSGAPQNNQRTLNGGLVAATRMKEQKRADVAHMR